MKKYRVGYTDGTYDMFHVGHLNMIESAKEYCDYLIVAVHGDDVVRQEKPNSPIIGQEDRRRIVAAIKGVDQAEITKFRDKKKLWELYHFDAIFIGDDWKGTERWNRFEKELNEVGVDVIYLPYTKSISTTAIRKRVIEKQHSTEFKLLSIDLDGTLLDSSRQLSEVNKKAIEYAKNSGVRTIISTGSPFALIPHEIISKLPIDYVITTNGSAIYDYKEKNCLYEKCIDVDTLITIFEFLIKKDIHIDLFANGKAYTPQKCKSLIRKMDASEARKVYLENNRVWVDDILQLIKTEKMKAQKVTLNFYPDKSGVLVDRNETQKFLMGFDELNIASGGYSNIEFTCKGADKGNALIKFCDHMNIDMNQVIAIGDSLNDLPAIETAGIGIAMENAMPEVKRAADLITQSNDRVGVAEAIYKLI